MMTARKIFGAFLLLAFLGESYPVQADPAWKLLVIYPASDGSVAEAQSALDQLGEVLKHQGLELTSQFVKDKPTASLADYDLTLTSADVAASLPMFQHTTRLLVADSSTAPHGQEVYSWWTHSSNKNGTGHIVVYYKQGLDENFFKNVLPQTNNYEMRPVPSVLAALKRVAEGFPAWVLLDSFQAQSLTMMTFPWAKKLNSVDQVTIEAPAIYLLNHHRSPEELAHLKKAMTDLTGSAAGQEILELMRLKSFSLP